SKEGTHGEKTHHDSGGDCPRDSRAKLTHRSEVPGSTFNSRLYECGLVAESTEPEGPASALPQVRSDGQGVQLSGRIQEPRSGCCDQGPPRVDDGFTALVAGRLWALWAVFHSHGVA